MPPPIVPGSRRAPSALRAALLLLLLLLAPRPAAAAASAPATLRTAPRSLRSAPRSLRSAPAQPMAPGAGDDKPASIPREIKKRVKRTGSLLHRFIRSFNDYDTTYIAPDRYNFTAMGQVTDHFQVFKLTGADEDGRSQSIYLKPASSLKAGPYLGWRWIFLGYTFDVTRPRHLGRSTEFSLSVYSSMLGGDLVSLRNKGNFRLQRVSGFEGVSPREFSGTPFSGLEANTTSLTTYYVANHRHFSYPAAFNQSTRQLKSCGSLMLGLGFSKQHVRFDYTKLPYQLTGPDGAQTIAEGLKFHTIDYTYYYLSAGYAYNWVFAPNCLLGVSLMPSIGLRKMKGEKIRTDEVFMDLKNLSLDCTSRAGIVWNNSRWFAGTSIISHLYMYRKRALQLTNSVNYLNLYAGFYFNRKKN